MIVSKHWNKGGKKLDEYAVGSKYKGKLIISKEATRTRKSMWITITTED